MRARGSKLAEAIQNCSAFWSRPVRARGSKHIKTKSIAQSAMSRPVRARGSKPASRSMTPFPARRAPCGRVDRNFAPIFPNSEMCKSRPVRARGSKLSKLQAVNPQCTSRPVRARGSKRWLERDGDERRCRAPCGRVDRNPRMLPRLSKHRVAPRAGAWIETP